MTGHEAIIRLFDNAHIPADPLNTDWQGYQAWIAEGNVAADAAVPAVSTAPAKSS